MSTRIDEREEFPVHRHTDAHRRRSWWHPAARWLLPPLLLAIGSGIGLVVRYRLLTPHDSPASAREPSTPGKKSSGSGAVTAVIPSQSKTFEVPAPVYDDTELYERTRTDIAKHPLLEKLGLHVQVVKIENGYVTLTALMGEPELMPRMEKQEFSDFLYNPIRGREDIKALLTLAEAIKKNSTCKGVFWEESRFSRAERLFLDSTLAFFQAIGNTGMNEEDYVALLSAPRTAALIAESLTGNPPEWLVTFEEALKEFPPRARRWTQLKDALRAGKIVEALECAKALEQDTPDAVKVAGDETLLLKLKSDWRMMAASVGVSLNENLARAQEIEKLLSTPTRSILAGRQERRATGIGMLLAERLLRNSVVQQEEDPAMYFTVLLHKLENDGRFQGWLTSVRLGDDPQHTIPTCPFLLVNHLFLPVEGTWDITFGSLFVRNRPVAHPDVLVREEDKDVTLTLTLRQQPGTRVYREEASRTTLEALEQGTDPALLERIAASPKKVTIRLADTEVEATSVVYAFGGDFYKGHPWPEMLRALLDSIADLPDGTLFQIAEQDPAYAALGNGLVRSSRETRRRAQDVLAELMENTRLRPTSDSLDAALAFHPEAVVVVTNYRNPNDYDWQWQSRREQCQKEGITVHVLCWTFPAYFGLYAERSRGEPAPWKDFAAATKGSFTWVRPTSRDYFWGNGPLVDVAVFNSFYRMEHIKASGQFIYADNEEFVVQVPSQPFRSPDEKFLWKEANLRIHVRQPVRAVDVPEYQRRFLPKGSLEE